MLSLDEPSAAGLQKRRAVFRERAPAEEGMRGERVNARRFAVSSEGATGCFCHFVQIHPILSGYYYIFCRLPCEYHFLWIHVPFFTTSRCQSFSQFTHIEFPPDLL